MVNTEEEAGWAFEPEWKLHFQFVQFSNVKFEISIRYPSVCISWKHVSGLESLVQDGIRYRTLDGTPQEVNIGREVSWGLSLRSSRIQRLGRRLRFPYAFQFLPQKYRCREHIIVCQRLGGWVGGWEKKISTHIRLHLFSSVIQKNKLFEYTKKKKRIIIQLP